MTTDRISEEKPFDLVLSSDAPSSAHAREGRNLFNVIDWRGQHRGQIALSSAEREVVSELLARRSSPDREMVVKPLDYGGGLTSYFNTLDVAKAAAQTDYEARILAALEAKP